MKKQVSIAMAVAVATMFLAGPAVASPTRGTVVQTGSVDPNTVYGTSETFFAREPAEVMIKGNGATKLHLRVFDSYGTLVAEDECQRDACAASWRPSSTDEFRVVIENLGSTYNAFQVIMD